MARQYSGRRILPGCCTWCAHQPHHGHQCTEKGCPCARHRHPN